MPRQAIRLSLATLLACAALGQTPVIVISIDTLRAGHLSAYGYGAIKTPNIDAFASQGTIFDAIDAQIPLTLPSHASLFTSIYPFENRIEENDQRLPAGAVTLASILRSHGYKTAAFVGSVLMDRSRGLDQGFDYYDSPFHEATDSRNPFAAGVRRDGALVLRAARQWLAENRNQPVFAFIHLFDVHAPYSQTPSPEGLPNATGYDAQIAYVDRLLGHFRQALIDAGWWDRSLIVLLSDHGESLGEHGELSHGYFIYQSTLHVPLIVHWPAGAASGHGARISQPGGLIDVAPTILDFLKLPAPPTFHGTSLLAGARAIYSESMYAHDAFGWAPLRSLREGAVQYIDAPKPELYDLQRDPRELHNLIGENPQMARTLRGRLNSLLAQNAASLPVSSAIASSQTRRALESLGYLGRGSAAPGPGADPKDRLPEYNLFEKALAAMYSGKMPSAIVAFGQLLVRDPRNSMARYYLAEAYQRANQPDNAVREWTNALKFDPRYVPAAEALGAWWTEREDYAKALAAFQKAVAVAPDDYAALLGLGIAEEHLGLHAEALQHLESACKIAPD
ncbi:MAG TPA: sulfatase-like hydrolase/transferase, partial [Bryobacteraceae bacterium]|nr:sulfatase-like hydrolase/transferase [Bryobacteraceae bacterium]